MNNSPYHDSYRPGHHGTGYIGIMERYKAEHRKILEAEDFPETPVDFDLLLQKICRAVVNINPENVAIGNTDIYKDQTIKAFRAGQWSAIETEAGGYEGFG